MDAQRLEKMKVWVVQKVRFWALIVDGDSEVGNFLLELAQENPKALLDWLRELDVIGQKDHFVGQKLFRKMRGWPGQWEVRRGDHRLMGFRVGDEVILCLHRIKHSDRADPGDLARIDRFAKEWNQQLGQAMESR